MKTKTEALQHPARLYQLVIAATLIAMLGFVVVATSARADDPEAEATLGIDLDGDLDGDGTLLGELDGAADLTLTGDDETTADVNLGLSTSTEDVDGTMDDVTSTVVDDVDACVACDDAVAEAHVTGSSLIDEPQVDACIIGACGGGTDSNLDGAVITAQGTNETNDESATTSSEICVIADCSGDVDAAARIYSVTDAEVLPGTTTADVCILGDCSGNGGDEGLDGVVGTIGTDIGTNPVTEDISADGQVCILAACSTDEASTDTSTDYEETTGVQAITDTGATGGVNPTGADSSDISLGDPVGGPTGDELDGSGSQSIPSGTLDDQSGDAQQGLPNTGFAPLSNTPLPLVALLALGAAWATGTYLIRRLR